METKAPPPQCMVSRFERPHEPTNPDLHFFGCLAISDRKKFFDRLASVDPRAQKDIRHHIGRVLALRARLRADNDQRWVVDSLEDSLRRWRQEKQSAGTSRKLPLWTTNASAANGRPRGDDGFDWTTLGAPIEDAEFEPHAYLHEYARSVQPGTSSREVVRDKMVVADLLGNDAKWPRAQDNNNLRWIHFPYNDVEWIEEWVSKTYGIHAKNWNKPDDDPMGEMFKLLDPAIWGYQERSRLNARSKSRHLTPGCNTIKQNQLAIFTPYYHLELERHRKLVSTWMDDVIRMRKQKSAMIRRLAPLTRFRASTALGQLLFDTAQLYEAMHLYMDKTVYKKSLLKEKPLHPKRTLYKSVYWTLKSTDLQDRHQVVARYTSPREGELVHMHKCTLRHCVKCVKANRRVPWLVAVGQLWIWIFNETDVVTSFQESYSVCPEARGSIYSAVEKRLQKASGGVTTAYDLALVLLDECSNTILKPAPADSRMPDLVDVLSGTIGHIAGQKSHAANQILRSSRLLMTIYLSSTAQLGSELNVNSEMELKHLIKEVLEEIDIFLQTLKLQKDILYTLKDRMTEGRRASSAHVLDDLSDSDAVDPGDDSLAPVDKREPQGKGRRRKRSNQRASNRLAELADRLVKKLEDREKGLHNLLSSAERTARSVDDLQDMVSLLQQEASMLQALESVKQGREAERQGVSIMLFTIFSIVFLPLTFMQGIFGMNAIEINGGSFSLGYELQLVVPISAAVIIVTMVFAFSSTAQSLSMLVIEFFGYCFAHSPLYRVWRNLGHRVTGFSDEQRRLMGERVRAIKHRHEHDKWQRSMTMAHIGGSDSTLPAATDCDTTWMNGGAVKKRADSSV